MRTELISRESLQVAALGLLASVESGGQISLGKISLSNGWQLVDQEYFSAYRIKAVNHDIGLFSKIFSSEAAPYATALNQTYQELAMLDLQTPILKPLGLERSALFFALGIFKEGGSLQSYLTGEQLTLTSDTILRHRLVPVSPNQRVDVVKVEGENFLVDVIEDSDASVYPFLQRTKLVE